MSVCVIITCFNEGPFIEAAIQSVLQQTRQDLIAAIIIHDDGSEQPTLEILERVRAVDHRINIIFGKANGVSRGRNLAAQASRADWLAFLDGDDVWALDKLEKQWDAVTRSTADFVYTGIGYFRNEEGVASSVPAKVADLSGSSNTAVDYFLKDGPITSTIMCRRVTFEKIGGYDENLRVFEDTEFYARFAMVSSFLFCPGVLVHKRVHAANVTGKRKDLMPHHASVAKICAANNPTLSPLIARRLADRARKLGNVEISEGNTSEAIRYYRMAVAMRPLSFSNLLFYLLAVSGIPLADVRSSILRLRRLRAQ